MAVKTITSDVEAYEALSRLKGNDQSFSQVIKQHLGPRRGIVLLRALDNVSLAESTLDAMEEEARRREENPAEAPEL